LDWPAPSKSAKTAAARPYRSPSSAGASKQTTSRGRQFAGAPGQTLGRASLTTLVVEALREAHEPWMNFSTLLTALESRRDQPIAQNSLRVLLSSLKRKQVIVRQGRLIALAERSATYTNDR
jgi:hypothetical protein